MQHELPSTFNCPPPSIIINEPSEVNEKEASFHVVVEINELNTPSTSTQESSFSHGSEKSSIHAPNRSSSRKKVRWENHRISEESITKLYPNQNTTSSRVPFRRNPRRFSDDFRTSPSICTECKHVLKLILLVTCCSIAVFLMQCLMYLCYVAITGESILDEIFHPKEIEFDLFELLLVSKNQT